MLPAVTEGLAEGAASVDDERIQIEVIILSLRKALQPPLCHAATQNKLASEQRARFSSLRK